MSEVKLMTKYCNRWLLLLIAVALAGVLVAGCGEEGAPETTQATEPATETTAAPTETTAAPTETTATGEVITLRYADQNPETGWEGSKAALPWVEQIEQATGGRVEIQPFMAETLFKGSDTWESLKAGLADFGWCFHGYWAGMTPLADVITLPFMPIDSAEQASTVLWQLYEEFPVIQDEFKDLHVVTAWTSSGYYPLTVNKKVESFDDLKGLKIRATGGPPTDVMKAMGATPVSMGMPDTYQALQTGVIDGILQNWEAMYSFRHYEVCKYITMVPIHVVYFTQSFNKASWDKLPADIQEAITSVGGLEGAKFWGRNMFDTAAEAVDKILQEQGKSVEHVTIPAEEVEQARQQFGEPLWEAWVTKMESEGHPEARDILNRALELLSE